MTAPSDHVTVDVRQHHIDIGDRHHPYACPVALAALEGGMRMAAMHIDGTLRVTMSARKGARWYQYWDKAAGKFADAFDQGKPVAPQSFTFHRNEL